MKNMKDKPVIAFVIKKDNHYRHFTPVMRAAINRGWRIESWHDKTMHLTISKRDSNLPRVENPPLCLRNNITCKEFSGYDELNQLIYRNEVDAVVSIEAPWQSFNALHDDNKHPLFILYEPYCLDFFHRLGGLEAAKNVDMFAIRTEYWLKEGLWFLNHGFDFQDAEEMSNQIKEKSVCIGWPQLDQKGLIDPVQVRKCLKIPKDKPVVTLLNWVDSGHFGLEQAIFASVNLKNKLLALFKARKKIWENLGLLGKNDFVSVMESVHSFCRKNSAYLIVKSRQRDHIPPQVARLADKILYDENYYPHTTMELMSISDLCIGSYSFAVTEAAAYGVPFLIHYSADFANQNTYTEKYSIILKLRESGNFFNYPGVVFNMDNESMISRLPSMKLGDFHGDSQAQAEFLSKFIGFSDKANSDIFLEALLQQLNK
jgi:hypothetical protein